MKILPPTLQQVDRTYVRHGQRRLSYFSGCDYFRLASHPAVIRAAEKGLNAFGLNVAASRMTTGNHRLYEELEARLSEFFGVESALLFSSGYASNLAVAQALAGTVSHALIDERAHASLADAAQWLGCPVLQFRHRDPEHAAQVIRRLKKADRPLLLTDGLFAHDGSIAPLKAYLDVLPPHVLLLVDDAHAAGILGSTGKGTAEHAGVPQRRILQTITLSKAFGVYGGAVLGSRSLCRQILSRSRMFAGNTPMPLPLVSAALQALKLVKTGSVMRTRLDHHVQSVKQKLRQRGYPVLDTPSPIIPMIPKHTREIGQFSRELLDHRIYPPLVKYPGGPAIGYFRFVLSSEHRREQLDDLLQVLLSHFD
jgi:7-keto-8-aminopelargonate synthetase-like enzyme